MLIMYEQNMNRSLMIIADMHTHTDLSGDCNAPIKVMIEAAKLKGLQYYAVTDHHDVDYPECGLDFNLDMQASTNQLIIH